MSEKYIPGIEIEEVGVEVGFILGCTCSSLELEEDEDMDDAAPAAPAEGTPAEDPPATATPQARPDRT